MNMKGKRACNLTEKEMLQCIVHYACRNEGTIERMSEIVCSHFSTVRSLLTASEKVLTTLELPSKLVEYICLLREYAIRASLVPRRTILTSHSREQFAMMMLLRIGHMTTEVILGMLFTKERRFLGVENMALGSVNTAVFDVQTVIESIQRNNAHYVILAHNHPTGYTLPSTEDEQSTALIAQACIEYGYELLDHYIVTSKAVYSMYSQEYCIALE